MKIDDEEEEPSPPSAVARASKSPSAPLSRPPPPPNRPSPAPWHRPSLLRLLKQQRMRRRMTSSFSFSALPHRTGYVDCS